MANKTVIIDSAQITVDCNDYIGKKIIARNDYYEGNYLRDVRERYVNVLNINDSILDIGANIGNHSIFFRRYLHMRVYSFEPFPVNYDLLSKNTQQFADIIIYNYGLSNRTEKLLFNAKSGDNLGSARQSMTGGTYCYFRTLDGLKFKEKIGLIKIDVEGMETRVLQGAIKTLKKFRPIILLECFNLIHGINEYGQILFPIGYRLNHIEEMKEDKTFMLEFM